MQQSVLQPLDKVRQSRLAVAVVAGLSVTTLWFSLTWRYGFDLWDEGFYWYGAQRVLRGEVPIRDFMSYDIGRYYWAASYMRFVGDDGVLAARTAAAAYQALGTVLGVYLCLLSIRQRGPAQWVLALLIAAILTVWVFPYYKAYDHATSIVVVAALVMMLRIEAPAAWLVSGVSLGVAAMMGRNHGVYGMVAALFIVLVLLTKTQSRRAIVNLYGCFLVGVAVGFLPTLLMLLTVDGFAAPFMQSVFRVVQTRSTNIPLPIPWPWSLDANPMGRVLTAVDLAVGAAFVLLLVFPILAALLLTYGRSSLNDDGRRVVLAAVAASIPYAHYAFSRADTIHLSLAIFPLLIGLIAAGGAQSRLRPLMMGVGLLVASVLTVSYSQPFLSVRVLQTKWMQADVGEHQLWMRPGVFRRLQFSVASISDPAHGSHNFLAVPNMPGLHAIYRVKIPIWEIYSLFPRSADFQAREIGRLKSSMPDLVLVSDHALDGRPELRYSEMRPLIVAWVAANYDQLPGVDEDHPSSHLKVYSRKGRKQPAGASIGTR
jgi:hypothetical protein